MAKTVNYRQFVQFAKLGKKITNTALMGVISLAKLRVNKNENI